MRKLTLAAAAAFSAVLLGLTVHAASPNGSYPRAEAHCTLANVNGNGICDNHGAHCTLADVNGDGICDNHGAHCTMADVNGDGICDNWENKGRSSKGGVSKGTAAGQRAKAGCGGQRGGRHCR